MSNVNHYTLAVGPSVLLEQQKSYLLHRNYDSDFGDALLLVLANALNIKLNILNETLQHGFDVVPVIPRCNAQASLTLHRQGDHYNGICPIFGADAQSPSETCGDVAIPIRPRPTNGADHDCPNPTVPSTLDCHLSSQDDPSPDTATQNARRTYSVEFMRDITRSNICPLKRQTRKRLFKYRIWYNHVNMTAFLLIWTILVVTLNQSQCVLTQTTTFAIRIKWIDLRHWLELKETTLSMLRSKYLISAVLYLMWDHWKINVMLYLSTSVTITLTSFVWLNHGSIITSLIYCVWKVQPHLVTHSLVSLENQAEVLDLC